MGVTYRQGDTAKPYENSEFALTDGETIVFYARAPRHDETDSHKKNGVRARNLEQYRSNSMPDLCETTESNFEWERMLSVAGAPNQTGGASGLHCNAKSGSSLCSN